MFPPKRLADQGRNPPRGTLDVQAAQIYFGILQGEADNGRFEKLPLRNESEDFSDPVLPQSLLARSHAKQMGSLV